MNVRKIILEQFNLQREVPFVWGVSDCLTFAAGCAEVMLGRDPIPHLRGRYNSEVSMRQMLANYGWNDAGDLIASIFTEIPVAKAQAGDWVFLINIDNTETIGVVVGSMVAAKTKDSVGQTRLSQAKRAFRVS